MARLNTLKNSMFVLKTRRNCSAWESAVRSVDVWVLHPLRMCFEATVSFARDLICQPPPKKPSSEGFPCWGTLEILASSIGLSSKTMLVFKVHAMLEG